jgi:uncharacterized protein YeaO (DUF488 family)
MESVANRPGFPGGARRGSQDPRSPVAPPPSRPIRGAILGSVATTGGAARRGQADGTVAHREAPMQAARVSLRRVYDAPAAGDGHRVLVDRLWPRGLAKTAAAVDEWMKAVAPSDELRRWYGHEPRKFEAFRHRYEQELQAPERTEALDRLRRLARPGPLTLLTATRDIEHSQAAVLADWLRSSP